jgi:hypothetical protein
MFNYIHIIVIIILIAFNFDYLLKNNAKSFSII